MKRTLLVILSCLALSACGSSPSAAPSRSSTPSSGSSTTAAVKASTPTGWQDVPDHRAGFVLSVPGDWTIVDPTKLDTSSPRFAAIAKMMNQSADAMRQVMKRLDFMAVSANHNGVVDAVLTPMMEIPTKAALEAGFSRLNLVLDSVATQSTPLGPALMARLTAPTGHRLVGIFIQLPKGIENISIDAPTAQRSDDLARGVIASLRASH